MTEVRDRYGDIINMERPESDRPHMSAKERAAQFSPFAALSGYDDLVAEAARLTDKERELDPAAQDELANILNYLIAHKDVYADFTVFKKDKHKSGGSYSVYSGRIEKADEIQKTITLDCGIKIFAENIVGIELADN